MSAKGIPYVCFRRSSESEVFKKSLFGDIASTYSKFQPLILKLREVRSHQKQPKFVVVFLLLLFNYWWLHPQDKYSSNSFTTYKKVAFVYLKNITASKTMRKYPSPQFPCGTSISCFSVR